MQPLKSGTSGARASCRPVASRETTSGVRASWPRNKRNRPPVCSSRGGSSRGATKPCNLGLVAGHDYPSPNNQRWVWYWIYDGLCTGWELDFLGYPIPNPTLGIANILPNLGCWRRSQAANSRPVAGHEWSSGIVDHTPVHFRPRDRPPGHELVTRIFRVE